MFLAGLAKAPLPLYTEAVPALALVLAALSASAQEPVPVPVAAPDACPYRAAARWGGGVLTDLVERLIPAGSTDCRDAGIAADELLLLRATVGLDDKLAAVGLFRDDLEDTAAIYEADRRIDFSRPVLPLFTREPALRRLVIAHELGHALQKKLGVEPKALDRRFEAQADAFAARMLDAAGFSKAMPREGYEAFFAAFPKRAQPLGSEQHPSPGGRFLNLRLFELEALPKGAGEPSLARFNDRGILKPELWLAARLEDPRFGSLPPPPAGTTDEDFRAAILSAAERLLLDPEFERRLGALAFANRGTDLSLVVARAAVDEASLRAPR